MNNAMNTGVQIYLDDNNFTWAGGGYTYPEMQLLDQMVVLFFTSSKTFILFVIVYSVPFFPTSLLLYHVFLIIANLILHF